MTKSRLHINQSRVKWMKDIPEKTKYIISGYVREAQALITTRYSTLWTIPELINCLCTDYYYDRETLCEIKKETHQRSKSSLSLDASRTKAAFDCGFGHQSRELLGSTVTSPSFRGSYRWKLRIVCDDPDIGISADFGLHTEFEDPTTGRRLKKSYNIEATESRPDLDSPSANERGMICDLELDTIKEQFTVRIDGWSQWEEEYMWPVYVDKRYCVRMAMHCKGTLELMEFQKESATRTRGHISSNTSRHSIGSLNRSVPLSACD